MQSDIYQNLPKIAPKFSPTDEKQEQIVQMIKKYEVEPQLKTRINMDIPGLRKKKQAFSQKPANRVWWQSFSSYERNGMINVFPSRNWARLVFPCIPVFFFVYFMTPVLHGTHYKMYQNNYQWESVYYKYGSNRPLYTDVTHTRLA